MLDVVFGACTVVSNRSAPDGESSRQLDEDAAAELRPTGVHREDELQQQALRAKCTRRAFRRAVETTAAPMIRSLLILGAALDSLHALGAHPRGNMLSTPHQGTRGAAWLGAAPDQTKPALSASQQSNYDAVREYVTDHYADVFRNASGELEVRLSFLHRPPHSTSLRSLSWPTKILRTHLLPTPVPLLGTRRAVRAMLGLGLGFHRRGPARLWSVGHCYPAHTPAHTHTP